MFVIDGLVWAVGTDGNGPMYDVGRDLLTGEIKKRFEPWEDWPTWHHHRFYRNKATEKYIIAGRTVIEFVDLTTGKINWVFQATENDVWNAACDTDFPENCPVENGPDFDFGGATVVVDTSKHGKLVVAGQKSGFVHAVKPRTGELVWQTRVGRGGIQGGIHFGIAAKGETLLVPVSDMGDGRTYPNPDQPGMNALDANTGKILWTTLHDDECGERTGCDPGISQVVTVVGDLVIGGAMDGVIRAYAIETGEVLWQMDTTTGTYPSITGQAALGGSFGGAAGPIAFDGKLLISAGYGMYNHMPGNLFMVLEANK